MIYHPFRDLALKGLAVGLAVLLWLNVAGEPVVERGLQVPLEFENMPVELGIADEFPDTVQVRLRGSAGIVGSLEAGDVVAVLDLSDERPGRQLFDLSPERVQVPPGVEVTSVIPATVTLALERGGSSRTVPIVPSIEGEPAEGYVVGRISTQPHTVDVIGLETRLEQLGEALTGPVSVAGAADRIETIVTVGVADPTLRLSTPLSAHVTVDIVQAPIERTLHDLPVLTREANGSARAKIDPDRVTVSVVGQRTDVLNFGGTSVQAYVEVAGLGPGRYNLPVTVELNGELRVTHIDPPFVGITLR